MKATIYKCEWADVDKTTALVDKKEITLKKDEDARLSQLQKIVGGWIDIYNHQGDDLVIDDEGLVKGKPLNFWAYKNGLKLFGTIVRVHGKLEQ